VFVAGEPGAYSRPGLTYYTVPSLLDFRDGVPVQGARQGDEWVLRVPLAVVGARPGDLLESLTAFSVVASPLPPFVVPGAGPVPRAGDATPAVNVRVGR
jgi:hypothetical protein